MNLPDRIRRKLTPVQQARAAEWIGQGRLQPVSQSPAEQRWRLLLPSGSAVEILYWPEDQEGECSCEGGDCLHLSAVLQAQGRTIPPLPDDLADIGAGAAKAGAKNTGAAGKAAPVVAVTPIQYRLVRLAGSRLALDWEEPPGTLRLPDDLEIRRRMSGWKGQPIPPLFVRDVLPLLRGRALRLQGSSGAEKAGDPPLWEGAVQVDTAPVLPRLRVEDRGSALLLRLVRPAGIAEVFIGGPAGHIVRMGGIIRVFQKPDMEPRLYDQLQQGMTFTGPEIHRLAVEFLPGLRKRHGLEADVLTKRLPEVVEAAPRLHLEVETEGERLRVVPKIVYSAADGDPPLATIERGEFRLTGQQLPRRDTQAEARLREQLHTQSGGLLAADIPLERNGLAALRLLDSLHLPLRERITARAPQFRRVTAPMQPAVAVSDVRLSDGAGWRLRVDGLQVAPDRLIAAWQGGQRLIQTAEGWQEIPQEWLDRHGAMLAELLSVSEGTGVIRRESGPLLLSALEAMQRPVPPSMDPIRALVGDFRAIPHEPPAPDFEGSLRPYQQQGLSWLLWLRSVGMGGILADDMGLGKTVQCLAALSRVPGRHLVVAPTSVLRNWEQECRRFLPARSVCLYYGADRALDPDAFLTLTSYALLRIDLEILQPVPWAAVVLDEAQMIKNPDTQAAQAAFALQARHRLAMSGTPVENRLEELWSAFHFACPGLLGGRAAFRDRFENPISAGSRTARDDLRRRIRPFLLRRLKSEVARDLPPRTEIVLRCALSLDERRIYQAAASLSRADIAKMLDANRALSVLEVLLRMRQAACHPGLLNKDWQAGSAKMELLTGTLEEILAEGHCALVFSQWTSLLDRVEPELQKRNIRFVRLDGSTRDRAAVVAEFSAEDGPPVFLLSLKAGGTGLNLTRADYVFHLDPWWNPAAEDQATDRAHRIGQQRPVISCRLIAEDTVEEKILELQERKRELVRAAMDEGEMAKALTREDLLGLF